MSEAAPQEKKPESKPPNAARPSNGSRPSSGSVAARAARMARKEIGTKVSEWASSLGVKAESPEQFGAAIAELRAAREKGLPEADRVSARIQELEAKVTRLEADKGRLQTAYNRSEKERKRMVERRRMEEIESEIATAATAAGLRDPKYALHLFREHINGGGAHAEDPKAFFGSLRSSAEHKHLFREESVPAGPQPPAKAPEAPAPEASVGGVEGTPGGTGAPLPSQGAPPPARPGKVKPNDGVEDVRKLDHKDFAKRTADRYGFQPPR